MPESFELTWVTSEPVRRALATVLHLIQSHFGQCGALLPETSNDVRDIKYALFFCLIFRVANDPGDCVPRAQSSALPPRLRAPPELLGRNSVPKNLVRGVTGYH